MIFKKTSINYSLNYFIEKTMESVGNGVRLELIKKEWRWKFFKQQSKLTFKGVPKSYQICDNFTFKKMNFFVINQYT